MPSFVVKAERDSDLYMVWSTITDGPVAVGTRTEITDWLDTFSDSPHDAEDRLARADARGTSAMYPAAGEWNDSGFVCNWDRTGNHEVGSRWLPRQNIAQWLRTGDESLLQPIGE